MQEWNAQCELEWPSILGEGPCWDPARQALWWVDINQQRVSLFDPAHQSNQTWDIGTEVGFALPTTSGVILCGARNGLVRLDPETGNIEPLVDLESEVPRNRINDGKCDPQGRLWAGTLSEDRQPVASLYRIDKDLRVERAVQKVTVSNGLAWSSDHRTMYYIDSQTFCIDAFDFDPASGSITNRRSIIQIEEEWGKPDGMTIDAEGRLWVALFRGHAVTCWDPETAKMIGRVNLPVANPTSCCFGGPNLETLYITSARAGLDEAALREQPLAGSLFSLQPGVCGLPATLFPLGS